MLNKYDSPIVKVEARKIHELYSGHRTSLFGEQGDLAMIMLGSFLAYLLFLYYVMPNVAPQQYARAGAELSYHWRNLWYSFEYQYYTEYLPLGKSLLQDLMGLLPR